MKYVAVLSNYRDTFNQWSRYHFPGRLRFDKLNKFTWNDSTYISVINIVDLRGWAVDSVIELRDAKDNPDYHQMWHYLKQNLKSKNSK